MKINETIKKELAQSLCELSNQLVKNNIKKETAIAVYGLLFLAREDMDIQDQEIFDYCMEVNEEVPGDDIAPWSYYTARDITEILGSGSTREAEYWTDSEADAIAAFLNGRDFLRRKKQHNGKIYREEYNPYTKKWEALSL